MRTKFACLLLICAASLWAQDDPPSRVARLNFLEGSVSLQSAGHDDWTAATPNYPLTTGDRLWADDRSRAELHIGSTALRLDDHTAVAFLNLDDRMTQVRLSDGTLNISIRRLDQDESYEVDTPNGAVTLLRPGAYRIDADPDRQTTTVTVRSGEAEITAGGQAFPVHARQSAFINGTDQPSTEVTAAARPDDFDSWWENRDEREARRPRPRYVSEGMIGSEDLDEYGSWRDDPGYGAVWYPRTVVAGWAPYRYGHWVLVEPWGWTWVDDAPWGFAPFHYGRWAYIGGGWGWVPGAMVVRPVYAPALVAWVGGSHWGVGMSFGGGGGVGWLPLGPREAYVPSYRVSNTYITRVNVTNVTNVTNITNVTNVHYVNQNVPGAVTAVSRADFASSRPVARVAVAVPAGAVASATVTTREMPVTRQEAMAARPVSNVAVSRPPQSIVNRPVVTKTPPPAATTQLARPNAVQVYRPNASQPVQSNRPVQSTPPVYRPPVTEQRPQTQPPPAYRPPVTEQRPQTQPPPAYRPPVTEQRPQTPPPPTYRPPVTQERPQSQPQPAYRQERPQAQPHNHGPDRPQKEERTAPPKEKGRPEKSKER
jgi:hypothetical protein